MKAELRKKQILDISTKMFSEKGYHETHVELIIKTAKVGKGTFYRYFKNKEDLFVSVLQHFLDKWEKEVFIAPSTFTADTIFNHFQSITIRSFHFFKKHDDLCYIYFRISPGLSSVFQPYIERFENQMIDYVIQYLKAGISLGYVQPDVNLEMASNIIVGAFLRVEYFYFVLNKNESVDIETLADDYFHTIMNGILIKNIERDK